jgi:hypothetical protein
MRLGKAEKDKPAGSKRIRVLDIALMILVIGCLIVSVYSYYSYTEYTESITQQATVNDVPVLDININFTSTVFAAQNDIQVSVIVYFDPQFQATNPSVVASAPSEYYVYFQGSSPKNPVYYRFGEEKMSPIILHRQTDGTYRNSTQTIRYESEGDKCFTASWERISFYPKYCSQDQQPIIHISSADSLFQLQTQHVTLALTWAALAFTVILVRDFIIGVGTNWSALRRKEENKTADDSKHKKS